MANSHVLAGVRCAIAPNLPNAEQLQKQLESLGAVVEPGLGTTARFLICEDDLYDIREETGMALLRSLRFVKASWVDDCMRAGHQLPWDDYFIGKRPIFSGARICSSQIQGDDLDILWVHVVGSGGDFQMSLDASCTHLVLLRAEGEKYEAARQQGNIRIVSPMWVIESCAQEKRLNEDDFPPNPPTTKPETDLITPSKKLSQEDKQNTQSKQSVIGINRPASGSQEHLRLCGSGSQSNSRRNPGRVFWGCRFCMVHDTRPPSTVDWRVLEEWAEERGAELSSKDEANYVICLYKDHPQVDEALKCGKAVASPRWLEDVAVAGFHFAPSAPHHNPMPRTPIPEALTMFDVQKITLSGYTKRLRNNLQWMISHMGGEYMGALEKNVTTHLVCKSATGEKYLRAQEWGIPTISHQWLEDSFRQWHMQPTAKYTSLPGDGFEPPIPAPAPFPRAHVERDATSMSSPPTKRRKLTQEPGSQQDSLQQASQPVASVPTHHQPSQTQSKPTPPAATPLPTPQATPKSSSVTTQTPAGLIRKPSPVPTQTPAGLSRIPSATTQTPGSTQTPAGLARKVSPAPTETPAGPTRKNSPAPTQTPASLTRKPSEQSSQPKPVATRKPSERDTEPRTPLPIHATSETDSQQPPPVPINTSILSMTPEVSTELRTFTPVPSDMPKAKTAEVTTVRKPSEEIQQSKTPSETKLASLPSEGKTMLSAKKTVIPTSDQKATVKSATTGTGRKTPTPLQQTPTTATKEKVSPKPPQSEQAIGVGDGKRSLTPKPTGKILKTAAAMDVFSEEATQSPVKSAQKPTPKTGVVGAQAGSGKKTPVKKGTPAQSGVASAEKQQKPATTPGGRKRAVQRYSIMFTGLERAVKKQLTKVVGDLKGTVVEDALQCNIMVADRIARTVKFLTAISVCHMIVTPAWLTDSQKAGAFVDMAAEEKFCFRLNDSLQRAATTKVLATRPTERRLAENAPFATQQPLGIHVVVASPEDIPYDP